VRTVGDAGIGRLLVVGAHAFDAEVIGGPLAATVALSGGQSMLVHLSLGEQGHRTLSSAEYAQQKHREADAAAAALGCAWSSLRLPDGFISDDDETALRLSDVIREFRPDTVVTHWSGSWHKDHRAAHKLTIAAVFFAALPTLVRETSAHCPAMVLFGENWEDSEGFRPEYMVDVSNGMEPWRRAINEYELGRGLANFPYFDYYSSLYRLRGCLNGSEQAQGFSLFPGHTMVGVTQFLGPTSNERRD